MNVQSTTELALVLPVSATPFPWSHDTRGHSFAERAPGNGIVYRGEEASRCKVLYNRKGKETLRFKESGRIIDFYV